MGWHSLSLRGHLIVEHIPSVKDFRKNIAIGRLEHLDSLRGLAALAVALRHSIISIANPGIPSGVIESLGYPQVLFFFVLSGFVLSRSLNGAKNLTREGVYSYLIRRFFRLYPTAILSLVIAALLSKQYASSFTSYASDWLIHEIQRAQSVCTIWGYLSSLTLKYPDLNGPLWTIRVECWCSLFLPFILMLVLRWKVLRLPLGAILAFVFFVIGTKTTYIFVFYLGYLIFYFQDSISRISSKTIPILLSLSIVIWCGALFLNASFWIAPFVQALLLISMIPCREGLIHQFLLSSPLRFLGRISYSFYLLHCPILLFSFSAFEKYLPKYNGLGFSSCLLLFFISVAITLPIAWMSELYIEKPMNDLGKFLAGHLTLKQKKI